MVRKRLSILLSFIFILALSLSGCTGGKPASESESESASASSEPIIPAGQYPVTKDTVTLTAFVTTRPNADDYKNNEATKFLEKKLNVNLEFVSALDTEAKQKISLLLSSGAYPGIILRGDMFQPSEINMYASQGIFIPVDDFVSKYGGNIKEVFTEYPDAETFFKSPFDNKMHCMPTVNDAFHTGDTVKMWYHKPTLDKLGLKPPTTTDEFYNVLMTIKQQNPKNAPPAAGGQKGWNSSPEIFLSNAFVFYNGDKNIWIDNGKIMVTYNTPEYKEAMKYVHKLVQDGLVAKESFTQDGNALVQMCEADPQTVAFSFGGYQGSFQDLTNSSRWKEWFVNPALKGPNGVQVAPSNPDYAYRVGSVITDKCENPDVAYKFLDALYDQDIMMTVQYGQEGRDWRLANQGEVGNDGGPASWAQLQSFDKLPKNTIWDQVGNLFWSAKFRLGMAADVEANPMEKVLYEGTRDSLQPYYQSADHLWRSNIIPSNDEQQEISTIEAPLKQYVNEMAARFSIGDVDIDKGWDDYLKHLKSLNLDRYLELLQTAYDRQYKK